MPNIVTDTIYEIWSSRGGVRKSPHGWLSGNAVCCEHNGETRDRRRRGGVKLSGEDISYHCFNCGFSTGYKLGGPLGFKMRSLLEWLDVPQTTIDSLKFEAFRLSALGGPDDLVGVDGEAIESPSLLKIKSCPLPPNSVPLVEVKDDERFQKHVEYIHSRGLSIDSYPFFVTDSKDSGMDRRIIIPFVRAEKIVGFTARAIDNSSLRYIMNLSSSYVFGLDLLDEYSESCFAMEGPIDALSIGGIAFMGSEVSPDQISMVRRLRRKVIIIPDYDSSGLGLIDVALENKWSVSFPDWGPGIKDVNAAVLKYGKLLAIRMILSAVSDNPTEIKVRQQIIQRKFR
jgi:hypothetical protein